MAENIGNSVADTGEMEGHREWDRASYAIFDALEELFDDDLLDQPPMINTVDLDAVDRFFEGEGDRSLSFEYGGVCVTVVRKDGQQRIVLD